MQVFGWILFVVGILMLVLSGLIGFGGLGNIPGLLIGTACMICGSVFVGSSSIVEAISGQHTQTNKVRGSTPNSANKLNRSSDNQEELEYQQKQAEENPPIWVSWLVFAAFLLPFLVLYLVQ